MNHSTQEPAGVGSSVLKQTAEQFARDFLVNAFAEESEFAHNLDDACRAAERELSTRTRRTFTQSERTQLEIAMACAWNQLECERLGLARVAGQVS